MVIEKLADKYPWTYRVVRFFARICLSEAREIFRRSVFEPDFGLISDR